LGGGFTAIEYPLAAERTRVCTAKKQQACRLLFLIIKGLFMNLKIQIFSQLNQTLTKRESLYSAGEKAALFVTQLSF